MKSKQLDIASIFNNYATEITAARTKAVQLHGTSDIKAAGNEIEEAVRNFFRNILPKKYNVTHGHLIDLNGKVSPQIDLIISDNNTLPSLLTAKDGTEYIPVDSVYAIAEIKSTFYKNKGYISEFSQKLQQIRNNLSHQLVSNTAYGGQITGDSTVAHVLLGSKNKYLNKIFSFLFCIDANDFDPSTVSSELDNIEKSFRPNMTILLNSGAICYGIATSNKFTFERYPDEIESINLTWHHVPFVSNSQHDSIEGNTLSFIYYALLNHLVNSHLEPPNLDRYMNNTTLISKSAIQRL